MIFNLFRRQPTPYDVEDAYSSIVAQSRQVMFYTDCGVPDTVTGRFDMVSLHVALLLHRLRRDEQAKDFAQALVNYFFRDMDRSIRELGVTDIGVPKKVKTMGKMFYGLVSVLGPALDARDVTEVEAVLVRNVYPEPHPGAAQLAAYLMEQVQALAVRPTAELMHVKGAAA